MMAGCGGMQQGGASGSDMHQGGAGCGNMQQMQQGMMGNPMMCNPMQGMMGNPMMAAMMQNMMGNPMMGMMAQMQQMQQMQNMSGMMQGMLPGMGIGSMPANQMQQMQSIPGINQPPPPVGRERALEEHAELARCTPADLAKLEEESEQLEADLKKNAKKDAYVGLMARYKEDQGFGFISCPECKEKWEKADIYVSGRTFLSSGINVGDMVTFRVEKGGSQISSGQKGMVRAVLPETLHELTKIRKKLLRMREVLRARKQSAMQGMGAGGGSASPGGSPGAIGLGAGSWPELDAGSAGPGGCAPQKRQGAEQGPPAKRTKVGSGPAPLGS